MAGDRVSCLSRAYALQDDPTTEKDSVPLFQRACALGAAIGCTNYAAAVWLWTSNETRLACARRLFEMSCAAREPYACGMVARVLLEEPVPASPEVIAETKTKLEHSCAELGGFPCRVLARHLESGKLGPYEPGRIQELLQQACDGGDPDACGNPPSAEGTFD